MSNPNHPWCRDTARDKAVRAAEDAAAVPAIMHRDLPEQVALLWASLTDLLGRVVRIEGEIDAGEAEAVAQGVTLRERTPGEAAAYAEGIAATVVADLMRERDAARAECERLKAKIVALEGHSRMDIEREIAVEEAWERCGIAPHWPDDEAGSSQRYAASMEAEIGRLRARVAELEAAAAAGGQEPLACGAIRSDCGTWMMSDKAGSVSVAREIAVHAMRAMRFDPDDFRKRDAVIAAIGPLLKRCLDSVAAPPEPRGWLTAQECERLRSRVAELVRERDAAKEECEDLRRKKNHNDRVLWAKVDRAEARLEAVTAANAGGGNHGWLTAEEREAVEQCLRYFVRQEIGYLERNDPGHRWLQVRRQQEATLTALLARETPPRVKVPERNVITTTAGSRDLMWIAAIREAGGEVEE